MPEQDPSTSPPPAQVAEPNPATEALQQRAERMMHPWSVALGDMEREVHDTLLDYLSRVPANEADLPPQQVLVHHQLTDGLKAQVFLRTGRTLDGYDVHIILAMLRAVYIAGIVRAYREAYGDDISNAMVERAMTFDVERPAQPTDGDEHEPKED